MGKFHQIFDYGDKRLTNKFLFPLAQAHSISDIRFTGPCAEIMSTSFTTNEWDSDVDDSNSSEEFMYVKGTPPKIPSPELYKHKHKVESAPVPIIVEEDIESVWKSHEDKVPVTGIPFVIVVWIRFFY